MESRSKDGGIAGAIDDAIQVQREMVIAAKAMTHDSQTGLRDLIDDWQYRISKLRAALEESVK